VKLIGVDVSRQLDEWHPPAYKNIAIAACNSHQVVCAVGRELFYLEIEQGAVKQIR
jgi:DNA damage-binding protein 1